MIKAELGFLPLRGSAAEYACIMAFLQLYSNDMSLPNTLPEPPLPSTSTGNEELGTFAIKRGIMHGSLTMDEALLYIKTIEIELANEDVQVLHADSNQDLIFLGHYDEGKRSNGKS